MNLLTYNTNKDKQYRSKLRITPSIQFHLRIIMRGSEVFLILLGFGLSLAIGINSDRKRIGQKYTKDFVNKKLSKQFYSFTCILPDYVSHESPKEFWKNSHFEKMRADFLGRCQNSLWQNSPEMMHFQAWKNNVFD